MAKLPQETSETIWSLKRRLLDIVEEATAAEFNLFEGFGETKDKYRHSRRTQNSDRTRYTLVLSTL